jgi:hypothetical protein
VKEIKMSDKAEQASFQAPDETRSFERGALDLVRIGGAEIGRLTLQPGWRWSEHVKPLAGTALCEAPHFQYHVQGTLHVVMADGTEFDAKPCHRAPPGSRRVGDRRRAGGCRGLVRGQQLRPRLTGPQPQEPGREISGRAVHLGPSCSSSRRPGQTGRADRAKERSR